MRKFLLFIIIAIPFITKAQTYTEAQIKAAYIYKFVVNVEWPNEAELSSLKICVFGADTSVVPYLKLLAQTKKYKDIPFEVCYTQEFNEILLNNPQVVYVTEDMTPIMKKLYYEILTQPILMISDNSSQLLYVMLNFKNLADNKINFDIIKKNIEDQGLTLLPDLLVMGGDEIEVRELYYLKEKELNEEREKVRLQEQKLVQQQALIDSQLVSIKQQNAIILLRKKAIDSLMTKIDSQKLTLADQESNLNMLKDDIKQQQVLLNQKLKELMVQQDSIAAQKQLISSQKSEINEKLKKLDELNVEITLSEDKISAQKNELSNLQGTVESQRRYMGLMGLILALVIFIIIYIYRSYKGKKLLNSQLVQKNNEVEAQSHELQQINKELTEQRDQIKHQNDYITGSINYSKKIQASLLPAFNKLSQDFDHFLIYRPKDIVSGDFYWSAEVVEADINYKIIAVVDCTGHGVPGALLSIIGSRLLSEIVVEGKNYEPANILNILNRKVKIILKQKGNFAETNDGMDVSVCRIEFADNDEHKCIFAGAKSSMFYYSSSNKEITRIKGSRKTIGGLMQNENVEYEQHLIILKPNDVVYMPTDGYVDQNNKARKRFGSPRFTELLIEIAHLPANDQKIKLEAELDEWQGNEQQRDDITILGLRIR